MNSEIESIISADSSQWGTSLAAFILKGSEQFFFPELERESKRKDLWNALCNIVKNSQDAPVIKDCFVTIRILSREKQCLSELINDDWMDLIKKNSGLANDDFKFNQDTSPICVEALKSLSNILFNSRGLAEKVRMNGILQGIKKRIEAYKNTIFPDEVKFYDVKLLFLITVLCPEARNDVKDLLMPFTDILQSTLKEAAEKHVQNEDQPPIYLNPTQHDFVNEILKALFNITVHTDSSDDEAVASCSTLVEVLRSYLLVSSINLSKTWILRNNVINLLTNMPEGTLSSLLLPLQADHKVTKKFIFENYNMTAIFEILMFLKAKLNSEPHISTQKEVLTPLISVLVKGATSNRSIRKYLKIQILPPLKDVHKRPEEGKTIRNHLCRMLTTPITELRDLAAELLFVLCKRNVTRMIKYTGYGNAAGLFAQKGLLAGGNAPGAEDFSSDSGSSETEEYAEHKHGINPVLGCYEEPHPSAMMNMSEEQKEYEAMKLVELMDSLLKSGSIKPCRIGKDGKPEAIEHVLQLQEGLMAKLFKNNCNSNDDSD